MFSLSIAGQFASIVMVLMVANQAYGALWEKEDEPFWKFILNIVSVAFILFFAGAMFESLVKAVAAL